MRFIIDASDLSKRNLKTGIQRVFLSRFSFLAETLPTNINIQSVYSRQFLPLYFACVHKHIGFRDYSFKRTNRLYIPRLDDIFFALDCHSYIHTAQRPFLARLKRKKIPLVFAVHDALPYTHPHWFPGDAARRRRHWHEYLKILSQADLIFAVSQTTADTLQSWFRKHTPDSQPEIHVLHNGCDFVTTNGLKSISDTDTLFSEDLRRVGTFLMVGTLEPRKGHAVILDAFTRIWADHQTSIKLVIIGRKGWSVETLTRRLRRHPESGRRLFWMNNIDDTALSQLYKSSTCLIAASYGEGFGLPIVEAAAHGLPVIARDIPVFREVGGDWPTYFDSDDPTELAALITKWYEANEIAGVAKPPPRLPTWEETNAEMLQILLDLGKR